jgi:hypothetical protein
VSAQLHLFQMNEPLHFDHLNRLNLALVLHHLFLKKLMFHLNPMYQSYQFDHLKQKPLMNLP